MADLDTSVQYIHGVGPARAKSLEKLGITTLGELISWFPRRYVDIIIKGLSKDYSRKGNKDFLQKNDLRQTNCQRSQINI